MKRKALILSMLLGFAVCLTISPAAVAQKESLGAVKYTPPAGWTKTQKENVVTFSEINQTAGTFCLITLYAATASAGTPQADFASAWNNMVVQPWSAEASPETATEKAEGWTVIAGGSRIDFQGNKALAFLNVVSGFGKTVSMLAILNADSYSPQLRAFFGSIEVEKSTASSHQRSPNRRNPQL